MACFMWKYQTIKQGAVSCRETHKVQTMLQTLTAAARSKLPLTSYRKGVPAHLQEGRHEGALNEGGQESNDAHEEKGERPIAAVRDLLVQQHK